MAIDYHDLAAITDSLKEIYGQGITNQFADEKTTYNQFPVSERKPEGLGYIFSIRYARAQGTGARRESKHLPSPLVGKFDKGKILPKYIYGSLRLTGPMIEAAKSNVAAFVNGLADSVDDIYQSIIVDLNRQSWSDGFAKLGTVKTAKASIGETAASQSVVFKSTTGVKYFQPGMLVDFYNTTGLKATPTASGSRLYSIRVASVDSATNTVKFANVSAADYALYIANHPWATGYNTSANGRTVAANAIAIKEGGRPKTMTDGTNATNGFTSSASVEMMGLLGIYDDDTLLNKFEDIDTTTYPSWRANVLGNSSVTRELSIDLLLQALDLTRIKSGKTANVMRMGLGQRRKYANLLMPDVRFQPTVLKGGYETLTFAGGDGTVQFMIDPLCPSQMIFIEPSGTVQRYEMAPLGWGNIDQQWHQRSGYDEWDAFLRLYTNLGTEQRNSLTLVKDLVEPNIYS